MRTELTLPSIRASMQQEAPATLTPSHVNLLLLGLGFATGMEFYTFDSVNLVLVDLTGSLGVSGDEASWLLTVYSSALFLGVPVSIWLAGHVGYKRFLISTILVFAAASMGCAISPGLPTMLGWRAIQGLAGAGLVVWWRASIYLLMPKPQRSPSLMRVSTILYLSSALGLIVSGYITDQYNWRLIFLPNLVYAVAAIWLLLRYFPTTLQTQASDRLIAADWLGITLIAAALVSLQVILSRGQIDDWLGSSHIRSLVLLSASAFVLFVFWQSSSYNPTPLLRLDLLRDRHVMSSALIGILTGMILSGSLFVLPEFLRNISAHTLSATQTGRTMAVYALAAAVIRPLMVGVIAKVGQRKAICGALLMLIVSMSLFNRFLTTGTPATYFYLPLILYALCLSPLLPAVGSGTVAQVEQNKLLDGVSLYMTFRQFGASLGVALLTILIERRETLHSSRLFEHLQATSERTSSWLTTAASTFVSRGGYSALESQGLATKLLANDGARQAATLAYADAFMFMATIGVIALCLVPIIPPTPVAAKK
jgi:MFS transporter, DHA2 family, multidrug resistance protein